MEKLICPCCFREFEGRYCPYCGSTQNQDHQLPVGTLIRGRYRIGKVLGQGGFGITYMAQDLMQGGIVAVKEFFPGSTVFRTSRQTNTVQCINSTMIPHYSYSKERFLREASALVQFRDIPQVVNILDFSQENNTSYIIMEYVKGVNLEKYILHRGGKLSVEETFRILRPVMEALAQVHRGGIVHRDISPDNIMLDPTGGAKLLDFGAVRAVENPNVDQGLNKSTEAILKQGFAPIEQYNSRGSLGPWTDEYAMCATVWYCLTGRVPTEASIRVSEGIDPDWSSIPGLPPHQQQALHKGISPRAKDRYPSMDAHLAALFPGSAGREDPRVIPPEPIPEPQPPKAPKKRRFLWIPAAILALVIAGAAIFWPRDEKPDPQEPKSDRLEDPGSGEKDATDSLPGESPQTPQEDNPAPYFQPPSQDEKLYLLAEQRLEEGLFQEAIDIFTDLGDYKDSADRIKECHYRWAESDLEKGSPATAAIRFGKLSGYSDARQRSFEVWNTVAFREVLSAADYHTVGIKANGTAVCTGDTSLGRCDVSGWRDLVAVSASYTGTMGLKANGTVVATGENDFGQCNVDSWKDIVAICAGVKTFVGLRADGTVVATGRNNYGQCNVGEWTDIVAISAGRLHTVGLRADGTVIAVGCNDDGQCDVSRWTDIVAVCAGNLYTVGLKADGTVVSVGSNEYSQQDFRNSSEWKDIVALSAVYHTVGLKADGTVVAAGSNSDGQCNVDEWSDIVFVAAGTWNTLGLKADGSVIALGENGDDQSNVSGWRNMMLPQNVPLPAPPEDTSLREEETIPKKDNSPEASAYADAEALLSQGRLGEAAIAFGKLAGYADARERSLEIWRKINPWSTFSSGDDHTVGLKADGTVLTAGSNANNQRNVDGWSDIVSLSAGGFHTLGLKADGTVVAAGSNAQGQCIVSGWTDIVAINAGETHSLGLKIDGTVVAAGGSSKTGQCDVGDWTDIVAISAGEFHSLGVKADGTVVAAGSNTKKQCNVQNWTDIVAVSAGYQHSVGLKADGTVVAVGWDEYLQCNVSGWSNIIAISTKSNHTVGLKADGTLVAVGWQGHDRCKVGGWTDVVAISACNNTVGIRSDGTILVVGNDTDNQCKLGDWSDIRIPEQPVPFR